MKGLFDELNNILPNSPGSKSSKWEILTKCGLTLVKASMQNTDAQQLSSTSKISPGHTRSHVPRMRGCDQRQNSADACKKRTSSCATSWLPYGTRFTARIQATRTSMVP